MPGLAINGGDGLEVVGDAPSPVRDRFQGNYRSVPLFGSLTALSTAC
jgi:hypothetical protein